jgi:hypothetical protein
MIDSESIETITTLRSFSEEEDDRDRHQAIQRQQQGLQQRDRDDYFYMISEGMISSALTRRTGC